VVGPDRVSSTVDHVWDSFIMEGAAATDDVRFERGEQWPPKDRSSFNPVRLYLDK